LALLGAGIAVLAFKLTISPGLEAALERIVGLVLVVLGSHVLLRAVGGFLLHAHDHTYGGVTHRHTHLHLGSPAGAHVHLVRLGGRPFLVGLLHGLAGSAALTLLVLGTIPSPIGAPVYLLVFGVGSTAGMLLLSGLLGIPMALAAPGAHRLQAAIQVVAGVGSAALGIWMLAGPAA